MSGKAATAPTAPTASAWTDLHGAQRSAVLELLTQGWTLAGRVTIDALSSRGLLHVVGGEVQLTDRGRELGRWALGYERERVR